MLHRHLVKIFPTYRSWHAHPRHGFWHWTTLATASVLAAFVLISGWEVALREAAMGTPWGKVTIRRLVARASAPLDLEALMRGEIPPYTVRPGHPRLFITPENKDLIAQRIANSDLGRATFTQLIKDADTKFSTDFSTVADASSRYVDTFVPYIEAYGILYQLHDHPLLQGFSYGHTTEEYGQKGVEAVLALAKLDIASKGDNFARFTALAVGYDWLHDLLTLEQKQFLIPRMIRVTSIWPVNCPGGASIAPCDNFDSPDRAGVAQAFPRGAEITNPLAFYGDDVAIAVVIDGRPYTNAKDAASYLVDGIVKKTWWGVKGALTRREVLMSGGVTDEEMTYAMRYSFFMPALESWYTATGQDFFQAGTFWRNFILWHFHDLYPRVDKGERYYVKMQQTYSPGTVLTVYGNLNIMASASSWLGRGGFDQEADVAAWAMRLPPWGSRRNSDAFFYGVVMGDPLRPPRSPIEANFSTLGILPDSATFMRSSWSDPDATFAMHGTGNWMCGRSTYAAENVVNIWKNGGALITNKYGYNHDYGPTWRYSRVELYEPGDYGDIFNKPYSTALGIPGCRSTIDTSQYTDKGSTQKAIGVPGKYVYSMGDVSRYMQVRSSNAVSLSTRQFIWFPSGAVDYFLLFDRATTDGVKTQPHLVFNTVGEPVVSNNFDTPIPGASRVAGHWVVKNAPAITVTNAESYTDGRPPAHARLFAKILLPQQVTIHRLGGTGRAYTYPNNGNPVTIDAAYATDINDQLAVGLDANDLDGLGATAERHYCGLDKPCNQRTIGGLWRFNVVNQNLESKNVYLMAMEATDSSQPRPTGDMTLLEGQGLVGAAVANTIGLFNPVYAPLTAGTLTLPEGVNGTFRLLIADLNKNTSYTVTMAGAPQTLSATDAGTLYFESITLKTGDLITIAQAGATPPPPCTPNWQCTPYSTCSAQGTQNRTCTDTNACGSNANKPPESQPCAVTPPAPVTPPADGGGGSVPPAVESVRGDLSGDGKVTYADVRLHFQMLVNMIPIDLTKADLTNDGRLTLADFRALLRLVVAR